MTLINSALSSTIHHPLVPFYHTSDSPSTTTHPHNYTLSHRCISPPLSTTAQHMSCSCTLPPPHPLSTISMVIWLHGGDGNVHDNLSCRGSSGTLAYSCYLICSHLCLLLWSRGGMRRRYWKQGLIMFSVIDV